MPITMTAETEAKVVGDLLKQRLDEAGTKAQLFVNAFWVFFAANAAILTAILTTIAQSTAQANTTSPLGASVSPPSRRVVIWLAGVGIGFAAINLWSCLRQWSIYRDLSKDIEDLNAKLSSPLSKGRPRGLRDVTTAIFFTTLLAAATWVTCLCLFV